MHHQFGHPSKDILRQASGNTKNFPSGISYPKNNPVFKRCAEGKMPAQAFPKSDSRATKLFEKIHMDLKSMPVVSCHKYKYFIVFYDNFTSHGWTMNLKLKSEAKKAIRQFNTMVKNQHKTSIISVQIDGGGEFQSISLQEILGLKYSQALLICTNRMVMLSTLSGQLWTRHKPYGLMLVYLSPGENSQ
jgi:hypothetical protein